MLHTVSYLFFYAYVFLQYISDNVGINSALFDLSMRKNPSVIRLSLHAFLFRPVVVIVIMR
jgi:hypothetical protein